MATVAEIKQAITLASAAKEADADKERWDFIRSIVSGEVEDAAEIAAIAAERGYDTGQLARDVEILNRRFEDDALVSSIPVLREQIAELEKGISAARKKYEEARDEMEAAGEQYRAAVRRMEGQIAEGERARRRLIIGCPYRSILNRQKEVGAAIVELQRLETELNGLLRTGEGWLDANPEMSQSPSLVRSKKDAAEKEVPEIRKRLKATSDELQRLRREQAELELEVAKP